MQAGRVEIVATAADLARLANLLQTVDAVAIDTEFFWERTYYPLLGLVQVAAAPDRCWLVDAVQVHDLSPLGPLLASGQVLKILHDAPQDLAILGRACNAVPRHIFDTRLAAGFAGLDSTCSLQSLLQTVLDISLSKAETRSDWLRRPLSEAQLRYAADDVLHLIALRAALLTRCVSDEVRVWLHEELERYDDPASMAERDPRQMYLRVKGNSRLDSRQLAMLRELAAWRETEARRRDWPRGHLLSDRALIALVIRDPREQRTLMTLPDISPRLPGDVAVLLLDALTRGRELPTADCPASLDAASPGREVKARAVRYLAQIRAACAPFGIDPALVATQAEACATMASGAWFSIPPAAPHLVGWRGKLTAGLESQT